MNRNIITTLVIIGLIVGGVMVVSRRQSLPQQAQELVTSFQDELEQSTTGDLLSTLTNPLQIEQMRQRQYPGSDITVERTLPAGSNYQQQVVSYQSDDLKIFALMTIPTGEKPEEGWPVIVFNHGYIPPAEYRTTEKYVSYVGGFARSGYIVFKSDYRGHGDSEGEPSGAYGSPDYTVDVLNAVASLKKHPDVNANKIGMWGHSMGGYITLRSMVISPDIKAGVIWGGVVADYSQLLNSWRRRSPFPSPSPSASGNRRWRDMFVEQFGTPEANPTFWDSISANAFVKDISGPVQIHHAKGDESVPWEFSQHLADDLQQANKPVELFLYEGDDHNISRNFSQAMQRSITFFDNHI